jgi:transposase IS66 family protein
LPKKVPAKPTIEPSRLGEQAKKNQRPSVRTKASKVFEPTEVITIKNPPFPNAIFKGFQTYQVQELVTGIRNIEFRLARWELSDGRTYTEEVPPAYKGSHFGPHLRQHIIYQTHQNRVPQKKIHQELLDKGFQISAGQIDAILAQETGRFSKESETILQVGLSTSKQINVDDTGARHKGKNGYTTVVCNENFTYLKTGDFKSRAAFLKLLTAEERPLYTLNQAAFEYAQEYGLGKAAQEWLNSQKTGSYTEEQFQELLNSKTFSSTPKRILEEAALYATCKENGLYSDIIILSDGAGQFNVMKHALCWIHAERALKKVVPVNDEETSELKRIRNLVWDYYAQLVEYQKDPLPEKKAPLLKSFDEIFSSSTKGFQLAPLLKGFRDHKDELLLVLDHPYIPLHNNRAEQDIRHSVIKRKISGGTRSEIGRKSRDVFVTLFKTCQKLGISSWTYLTDRIEKKELIPNLGDTLRLRNLAPARTPSN